MSRVRDAISDFEGGRIGVDRLSWKLKSGITDLEPQADPEWIEELRALRNQVEVVNAFFIESGRQELTDDERQEVQAALQGLKAALEER